MRDVCERQGLRCGTGDGMATFIRGGDLNVGRRMVRGTFVRDRDLMWDREWYDDICERRGLRCGTEDGVRGVCERRGFRCGTEDGVRDICEKRGLRCGTEDGMGHVCQSSEMGLNEDWPIKRPCILIGGERKKSLGS